MSSETFVFKQFTIKQDKCPMKVGTDSVLLGSWINAEFAKHVLDIGTGTGILAIMLAQKTNANIDAIDLDELAIEQAKENVDASKWKSQITVIHSSLQYFCNLNQQKKYDLIVSNPPYFIDSYKSPEEGRTIARHNDLLSFQDLINGVVKLLDENGSFFVILPTREASIFKELALKNNLHLSNLLRVKTKAENEHEKRQLMEYKFSTSNLIEKTISIEKDGRHNYHQDYINLTKEYYIHF